MTKKCLTGLEKYAILSLSSKQRGIGLEADEKKRLDKANKTCYTKPVIN